MAEFTLQALKDELVNDPAGIGYAGLQADGDKAVALNLVRANIDVDRIDVTINELVGAIDTDYNAVWSTISQEKKDLWGMFLRAASDREGLRITQQLKDGMIYIWPAGATRTNLAALQTRKGSRAEQLWGAGTNVTHLQVNEALKL